MIIKLKLNELILEVAFLIFIIMFIIMFIFDVWQHQFWWLNKIRIM